MVRWQISAILGGAAAVAITVAALLADAGAIHRDLIARTGRVLAGEAMSWASIRIVGRDVALAGKAPSEELRALAVSRLGRVYGVRAVDATSAGLLPPAAPYVVSLLRADGALTAEGYAPSLPERARIVSAMSRAAPGLVYADRLDLARGMPEGFLEALQPLYPALALMRHGQVSVREHRVAIAGEAMSNADYDRLRALPLKLPEGYRLATLDVSRPVVSPFAWQLVRDEDGNIDISGFAPDPETRDRLRAVVAAAAGSWPVRDVSDLAAGAPKDFADVAAAAADYVDLLAAGRIALTDATVTISGRATTPEAYRTLTAYLEAWSPPGFVVRSAVDLPVVAPYTLTASRLAGRMTVTGFVPDVAARQALKAAAGSGAVVETTLAAGAPADFVDAAEFAIDLLGRLESGTAVLSDRHIRLDGVAATASGLLELQAAAASPPDGFTVDLMTVPPVVSPYVWRVDKTPDRLLVTGSVPSETVRGAIGERIEAVAGERAVLDRTTPGSGLPAGVDLMEVADFAASLITHLQSGTVTFSDGRLSIAGRAAGAGDGAAIAAAMAALPDGLSAGEVAIVEPPAFRLVVERGLDAIAIDGSCADAAMKAAIAAAARRAFGGQADIEMALDLDGTLPQGAGAAALAAVEAASRLAKGKVTVTEGRIAVAGTAFTGAGASRLAAGIAGLVPEGYRLETAVNAPSAEAPPRDAAACQAAFAMILDGNAVLFDGPAIAEDSRGLVDRLAAIALSCPAARLAIEGAGDGQGDAAVALGQARARALAGVFADAGVDPARLAVGAAGAGAPAVRIRVTPEP